MNGSITRRAPFIIALLRMLVTPVFFYSITNNWIELAFSIYLFALVSDVLDGYIARRYSIEAISIIEAFLDPMADFVFVMASFFAFSYKQYYPSLLAAIFLVMFLFFILTSNRNEPIYDPLGKYYGIFLILIIGLTILFPISSVLDILYLTILSYTILLVIFRITFITKQRGKSEGLNSLYD